MTTRPDRCTADDAEYREKIDLYWSTQPLEEVTDE